jgi:polysaccharide biosynthesis protein PslG
VRRLTISLTVLAIATAGGCGTEERGDPLARERPAFGFNEWIEPGGEGNELFADSGADFVRTPISWAAAEPEPGRFDFSRFDEVDEELAQHGLVPLWVATSAPCWAAEVECPTTQPSMAPTAQHYEAYTEFVAEVAGRYPHALAIQVWNEPNIPNFWRPEPDAAAYRELLAVTSARLRSEGSQVPLVMGGPSPTTAEQVVEHPDKIAFVDFLAEVLRGPDAPQVDAVAIHPYGFLQADVDPVDRALELFDEAERVISREAPGTPIWVTEAGLTTVGRHAVSEERQARGLGRLYDEFRRAGVPVIAIHRFFDQEDPEFEFEAGFGVVAADRQTTKPAYCALAERAGGECP